MNETGIIYVFENALKKIHNANLQRTNFYEKKSIKPSKNILKKLKKIRQVRGLYDKHIEFFLETLINKGANFDFNLFIRNIRRLNIIITKDSLEDADGWFIGGENTIYINEDQINQIEYIIHHELFHMASSCITKKKVISGFQHGKLYEGINEGYTQLLTNRYFKEDLEAYGIETKIAFLLELIVNKSIMEKMYSQGDIIGLINEISKYNNNNKSYVCKFLEQIDKFNEIDALPSNEFTFHKVEEVLKILHNIMLILIELFMSKLTLEKNDNNVEEFFSNLICRVNMKNQTYVMLNPKEIEEYTRKCHEIINENNQNKVANKVNTKILYKDRALS